MVESLNNLFQSNNKLIDLNNTVSDKAKENNFKKLLEDNINKVNDLQISSDKITQDFALGKIDNIHQVTIATEKARVALNLTTAIQNKVVDAYKEIMRLQV